MQHHAQPAATTAGLTRSWHHKLLVDEFTTKIARLLEELRVLVYPSAPFRGRHHNLSTGQQAVNVAHARIRALGEQAMATLKTWRLLRKLRCSTTRITGIVQAALTLT